MVEFVEVGLLVRGYFRGYVDEWNVYDDIGKSLEAFWITVLIWGSKLGRRSVLLFIPILSMTAFGVSCGGRECCGGGGIRDFF